MKTALTGTWAWTSESDRRITFNNGGMIEIRSTHYPDNLRGMGLDFVILDEAAYMEPSVWPEVVRPMLLGRNGGAMFLSTPRGHNWFHDVYRLGMDANEREWASFRYPTSENPNITQAELATIRRTTTERTFREEYLAEFISDSGQVFRGIYEAAIAPTQPRAQSGHVYIAGVDWGRENDYTVIAIIDASTGAIAALDRFRGVSWAMARERLRTLYDTWHPAVIWAEANSIGSVNIEALQDDGLPVQPFQTTVRSKSPLIEGLALAIERRELALLPDPTLMGELAAYTLQRIPGGGYRYNAPSGGHDDTVIATALAWHGVKYSGIRVDFA